MGRSVSIIDEACFIKAEAELKKLGAVGRSANRLQAILSSYRHGIKVTCEVLDISRSTLHRWVKQFKESGIEGLQNKEKPLRSKLTSKERLILKGWIESDPTHTLKKLVHKCRQEMGVNLSKSSIHRTLSAMGFAHITGRKKHHKANLEKQEEFKKNSKRK